MKKVRSKDKDSLLKSTNLIHHINKNKDKNSMILSITEKPLEKIQYPLMIQSLNKILSSR